MKKINNLDLGNIRDVFEVMKKPLGKVEYTAPPELLDLIKESEKKLTVHHYSVKIPRREEKCLLDLRNLYSQFYFAINDGKIHYNRTGGDTSGNRERHNYFINAFLDNKELTLIV